MQHFLEMSLAKLAAKGVIPEDLRPSTTLKAEDFETDFLEQGEPMTSDQLTALRAGLNTLSYAATAVRWDLLAVLGILASGQSPTSGTTRHHAGMVTVCAYVKATSARRLEYDLPPQPTFELPEVAEVQGEFDSNFASEKARSGSFIRVNQNTVQGRSWKQSTVSQSTCEAELTGCPGCAKEVMAVANFLEEFYVLAGRQVLVKKRMTGDNHAANLIANCQAPIRKVRHLTLQQLYVRELTKNGELLVEYEKSVYLAADFLTKVLGEQKLRTLLPLAHLHDP